MQQYHWELRERPYTDAEAKKLLAPVMDADTSYWHYRVHQKGYVDALNKIEKGLEVAKESAANGNYSPYGELKRRFPWNHAGALLHDIYWMNLGGDGKPSTKMEIVQDIEEDFGSMAAWKKDFIATAKSSKLSGWGLLVLDKLYSGRLMNVLVDDHQNGAIWGGVPIIALDMFEHAYYHKDGPDRSEYIAAFLNNLDWERINSHYLLHNEIASEEEDE